MPGRFDCIDGACVEDDPLLNVEATFHGSPTVTATAATTAPSAASMEATVVNPPALIQPTLAESWALRA